MSFVKVAQIFCSLFYTYIQTSVKRDGRVNNSTSTVTTAITTGPVHICTC